MKIHPLRIAIPLFAVLAIVSCTTSKPSALSVSSDSDLILSMSNQPLEGRIVSFMDTVQLSAGELKLTSYELSDGPQIMYIYSDAPRAAMILMPGGNTSISFSHDSLRRFAIEGDNAEGIILYNSLLPNKDIYRYEWVKDFSKAPLDTVAEKLYANFMALANGEIAQFDTLYANKKIDRDFLDFVSRDIKYDYAALMSKAISSHYYNSDSSGKPMYEGYMELWERIYNEFPIDKAVLSNMNCRAYADVYAMSYMPARDSSPYPETYAEHFNWAYNNYTACAKDKKVRETLLAAKLYSLGLNNKSFDTTLTQCFARFEKEFPGNPYSAYYTGFIAETQAYHEKIRAPFAEDMIFLENSESLTTLAQVIEHFKGDNLFIDFWFSSCGPCRADFAYNEGLKKFLDDNGIKKLYISVDGPDKQEMWENAIKYFDLHGTHLNAILDLHKDIYENYGIGSFPTYMIVNEQGKIVEPRAKSPSETTALYEQIKEKLAL